MKRKAFTLVELLVVISIMIILMAIMLPAIKSMTRNNSQKQAVNQIRAALAIARSTAIAQHRQVGIVFFEETTANAGPTANTNQTAMQFFVEDTDQSKYHPKPIPVGYTAHGTNKVYICYSTQRQYLPTGVMVGAFGVESPDGIIPIETIKTRESATGANDRAIIFDANGQLVLRNGVARPLLGSNTPGQYPWAYGDWRFISPASSPSGAVSQPGLAIFSKAEYRDAQPKFADDKAQTLWVKQHADIILVNGQTGNVIR